ncbi:hypothetical protein HBO34_15920 [Pseudomonas veronii]|uniref:hypothetical protein n=1 Tax=Pseudomonas veronii TaxID=76761 RepID=UPI001473B72A|nr:hypothetical protein [Pseudomonas veronii]NMX39362.1 hypothetical protein [Pseudomonas veronii]
MIKYAQLVKGVILGATAGSYYATPTATYAAIHAVSATNTTGAAVTVNLYLVTSTGTPSVANRIASRVVPANATVSIQDAINHKITPGSQLFADGLGCGLSVSGVESVPSA